MNEVVGHFGGHNRSGYKGVGFSKQKKKWRAYITVNYKFKHLGYFTSKRAASIAYIAAAKKYKGQFAAW